jgi:hypothetical protein
MLTDILGSAYRVIEFAQGFDGYLASHEVYFYVLEAVPMMPPFILFNVFHPGRIAKSSFKSPEIEATLPRVSLEQGTKTSGLESDSSKEEFRVKEAARDLGVETLTVAP